MTDQASRLRALLGGDAAEAATADRASRAPQGSARVTAVTSGKGGVGKTTIAVNLAMLLAEMGERVLLVDADLGLANVDVMLGLELGRHIGHLLMSDYAPEDVAVDGPRGIRVISGGSGIQDLVDAGSADRRLLLDKLAAYYGHFDRVIIDTSPGIGADATDFLTTADEVLIVTTTEPTSLRDSYAALKIMTHSGHNDIGIRVIVNMAASEEHAARAVAVLNEVTDRFLDRRFDQWHFILSDGLVGRSIRARKPLVGDYPRSSAALSLRQLAVALRATAGPTAPCLASVGER